MATKKKAAPATESRRAYLARRDARITVLWTREGMEPRDITNAMLTDGSLESESHESALRTVRAVVAKIRARLDGDRAGDAEQPVATNEIDALERKLGRLRDELARQKDIASGEPDADGKEAVLIVTMMGSGGDPFQFEKPKWPAGVRQKASKDAALLAEKVADLEIALAAKRQTETAGEGAGSGEGGLLIVQSEKSIEELIRANGVN